MPPTSARERKIRNGTRGPGERASIRPKSASKPLTPVQVRIVCTCSPSRPLAFGYGVDEQQQRSSDGDGSGEIETTRTSGVDASRSSRWVSRSTAVRPGC